MGLGLGYGRLWRALARPSRRETLPLPPTLNPYPYPYPYPYPGARSGLIQWVDNVTPLFSVYRAWEQESHSTLNIVGPPSEQVLKVQYDLRLVPTPAPYPDSCVLPRSSARATPTRSRHRAPRRRRGAAVRAERAHRRWPMHRAGPPTASSPSSARRCRCTTLTTRLSILTSRVYLHGSARRCRRTASRRRHRGASGLRRCRGAP